MTVANNESLVDLSITPEASSKDFSVSEFKGT